MKTIRFIMAIHNHQPVGNFDGVFERACMKAYHPFLDALDEFPELRLVFHFSGPLLQWVEKHDRALVERITDGARKGRFEILGGGYGEPIFTMLTDADLAGQVALFRRHLHHRYGVAARGTWLPERVWEPQLAGPLAKAGVEYTVVDDFHFRCAGLKTENLRGYYTTEDRGKVLRVFSGSEFLRYAIPFKAPKDTIRYLRRFATEDGNNVIVYADDGEKFGLWPETYEHVYENGWLADFLKALNENRDWIRVATFGETVDAVAPLGKVYLPAASYREMTEWVLKVEDQFEFEAILDDLKAQHLLKRARPFMPGGSWRSFKVKYVEAAQMYARMMEVSQLVQTRPAARKIGEAKRELYLGQCNCAYWHGVFGGLYMPFLRSAVYQRLLKAESLLARPHTRPGRETKDFDLDGEPEVKLHTARLACYLKPDRGGALYEFDDRAKGWNFTNVMTRRREAYHRRLVEAAREPVHSDAGTASIHDRVRWKEPGLEKLLYYDRRVRDSLVDHFYPKGTSPGVLRECREEELGDFAGAAYTVQIPRSKASTVTFHRQGLAGPQGRRMPVALAKRLALSDHNALAVRYVLQFPEGAPEDTLFAVELNLALTCGNAPDRNYFSHDGKNLNNLSTMLNLDAEPSLGLVDEWFGVELWIDVEPAAGCWAYPVETVNDSEEGFERIYQGSAIVPHWLLEARPGEEQVFELSLEVRDR